MKIKIFFIFLMGILFIPNFVLAVNQNTHSIDFESSSSQYAYITDADQTGLDITGDFTIEAWVKLESLNEAATIYAKSKSGGSELAFKIQNTGKIYGSYRDSSSNLSRSYSNNAVISDASNWTHLAVTCDVSEKDFKFYVNGSQVADTNESSLASSIGNNEANVGIGAEIIYNGNIRSYLDGLIDDVRVWNDVRTPTEIADNYKKELVGDEAGLVGYWKFNNNPNDTTSNDNDLTIANSPSYSSDYAFEYDPNPDPDPTPTTTPTIATEDAHIMNTILLILAFILGADLLRRIFTPLDKRRGL